MAVATALIVTPAQDQRLQQHVGGACQAPVPASRRMQAGLDFTAPGAQAAPDLTQFERRRGPGQRARSFGLLPILFLQRRL